MRRIYQIALSIGALLLPFTTLWSQGYVFGPDVRVNDNPPGSCFLNTAYCGMRGVAVRGDTVYCAWSDERTGEQGVWFARSVDGGQTFLPNVQADDSLGNAYTPTIAVGDDGTIYLAWVDMRPGYSFLQIYFSKSTDGGLTFTPDVLVNDTAGGLKNRPHRYPSMAVDTVGVIYIAFDDGRNGPGNYDIYFSKSVDDGSTFLPDVLVNDTIGDILDDTEPALALSDDGIVYVSWSKDFDSLFVSKSTDGGVTFGADVLVNDTISSSWSNSIDVDGRGYIHLAWRDDRNPANANIYYSRSTDGGLTFSPNIRVNDSIHEARPQASPSICVDDSGIVYVVWEDGPGLHEDIFFTLSTDNGDSSFVEPNVEVDDTDSSCAYPSIAVGDSGFVYVLWNDERNGPGEDAFLSVGRYESGIYEKRANGNREHKKISVSPNPFRNSVSLKFETDSNNTPVYLQVYDITGRIVKSLYNGTAISGSHTISWDGKSSDKRTVPTGVYFIKGKIGDQRIYEKVMHIDIE